MTDANLTEVVCVIDRSGSMHSVVDDAIGAFNQMLEDQKRLSGYANMTIALFDDCYDIIADNVPVRDVAPLNRATYVPRGLTALLDAIGRTIDNVGRRLAQTREDYRPGKVLFVVLTDGHENASHRYTKDKIREMIGHQETKYKWKFLYLSADINAFSDAQTYGFGTSVRYHSDSVGTRDAVQIFSSSVSNYRNCGDIGFRGNVDMTDSTTDIKIVKQTNEANEQKPQ